MALAEATRGRSFRRSDRKWVRVRKAWTKDRDLYRALILILLFAYVLPMSALGVYAAMR